MIAADTGPWRLAAAGYLNGRRAILHWQLPTEFAETFPDVQTVDAASVTDGRWLTCGSAAGAMDLVLKEIAHRFGPAARFDAAAMFLNAAGSGQAPPAGFAGMPRHPDPVLDRVIGQMAANVASPVPLGEIARRCGLTLRTMARLFETGMAMPPGRCHLQIRLARARELSMQPGLGLGDIAARTGFSCAVSLTRACRRVYGTALKLRPRRG